MPERTFIRPLIYAFIWAFIIFLLCNLDLGTSGGAPWYYFDGIDKVVHGILFFVLSILSCWGFYRQNRFESLSRHAVWFSLLVCILYGGLIEILQGTLFTYRSADWFDWVFDIAGALLGLWVFSIFKKQYLGGNETRLR